MNSITLKRFIVLVLITYFSVVAYGFLSAQTNHTFKEDCNCEPTQMQIQPRIYTPDPCNIVSGGAPFVLTQGYEVMTYQVIAKSQFWDSSPENSECNYLQVYKPYLGIYVTYVHPYMFSYFSEADIQRRISADGICVFKTVTLTYNPFPNAWEAINIQL